MMRRARLLGLALAMTAPALIVVSGGSAADGESVMGAGVTRQVSERGEFSYDPRPADTPAISDDGRFVTFMQQHGEIPSMRSGSTRSLVFGTRIWRRDMESGGLRAVSAGTGDASQPSISADGQRIAYLLRDGLNWDIVTADLGGKGAVHERVTGLPDDLPFQRTTECDPVRVTETDSTEGTCGPVLSGDGRSLALPVRQSIISPQLFQRIDGEQGSPYFDFGDGGLALVRLSADDDPQSQDADSKVIRIRVLGSRTLHFGVPEMSGQFNRFAPDPDLGPRCVNADIAPGVDCVIGVRFQADPELCGATHGMLTVHGSTPAAQTVIPLVGVRHCDSGGPVSLRRAASCPEPEGETDVEQLHASVPFHNFGELDVGAAVEDQMEVSTDYDAEIEFTASDCSIQLVPGEGDPGDPPCLVGVPVDLECIAHVRYQPTGVGPSVATLRVLDSNGVQVFHFVGAGRQRLVVMRRDPAGTGFTGPGAPPPRIVSVDPDGVPISGTAPSLSYDGRHVAFVSGYAEPFIGTERAQVLLHDSDARGDSSWVSGETRNVSIIHGPDADASFASYAVQPSLSGDGRRITFTELIQDNFDGWSTQASWVHVRDLDLEETVEASRPVVPVDEQSGMSYSPSLAVDGSTVAFTSDEFALVPEGAGVEVASVYVRDLAPDFDGLGEPRVDIVSLGADDTNFDWSGNPAISGDGGVVAFASSAELVGPQPGFCCDDARQVFTRARFPSATLEPTGLTFPPQQLGTTGAPMPITVTNDGPGPARISTEQVDGFVVTGGCGDVVHRGESCELLVASSPDTAGEVFGLLRVVLSAAQWEGEILEVELSGVGVPPVFSVQPISIEFGDQSLGIPSTPVRVRVRNVGDLPVDLVATVVAEPVVLDPVEPSPEPTDEPSGQSPPLTLRDAAEAGVPVVDEELSQDFEVTASDGGTAECLELAPGENCLLLVTFNPSGLGDRTGQLVVTVIDGFIPILQLVELAGTTTEPELALSPTIAREGRVVFVTGTDFLPGVPLDLEWNGGPLAAPAIVPDETGAFTAPVVVLPGRTGTHTLTLTMPEVGTIEAPPVVVVAGSLQPPDFVSRN